MFTFLSNDYRYAIANIETNCLDIFQDKETKCLNVSDFANPFPEEKCPGAERGTFGSLKERGKNKAGYMATISQLFSSAAVVMVSKIVRLGCSIGSSSFGHITNRQTDGQMDEPTNMAAHCSHRKVPMWRPS